MKVKVITGVMLIFLFASISVAAFSWNPFDWFRSPRLSPEECDLVGDVNQDEVINQTDLDLVVYTSLGRYTLSDYPCADLNYDEKVDAVDVQLLINILLRQGSFECPANQTIMKLSSARNAHGAHMDTNYPVNICYAEIFKSIYEFEGNNPWNCTGTNSILKLESGKNAHAEISSLNNYPVEICYGDLLCRSTTDACNMSDNEALIVSLSNNTNAHLAKDSSYLINVCCKSPSAPPLQPECTEDEDCETGFICDNGRCIPREPTGECTHDANCTNGQVCNFRNECENYRAPFIRINSPRFRERFLVGELISFNQTSGGSRDLTINWSFGDSNKIGFTNCQTGTNCNTLHNYTSSGAKIISVTAREQGGARIASNFTQVLIYREGINVFALIDRPRMGESIAPNTPVYFNANSTFVGNCTSDCGACLATGLGCYAVGKGNKDGTLIQNCPDITSNGDVLYCFEFNKSRIGEDYDLLFNWTFNAGTHIRENLVGTWSENYSQVVEFNRTFLWKGNVTANLKVTYGVPA